MIAIEPALRRPDVLFQRLLRRERPIDVAVGVGRDAFAGAVGVGIRNERRHLAVFRAPDPDPPLEGGIRLLVRLRVGGVEHVVPVDEDSARPAELLPLVQELAVLIEDLNAVVAAVGDEQAAGGVHRERVRRVELARPRTLPAPGLDERAVLRKLHDAGVGVAAVAVGDEDGAVGRDDDVRGRAEVSGPSPATPALPSVINTFPSGLNLNTWCPLPSLARPVAPARVALPVHVDAMRADEHPAAKARHELA